MGLRGGFDRALMFLLILMIQQYAAICLGLLISSIIADPALSATIVGPILALNIILHGGRIDATIPAAVEWLQYLTISFYSQNSLFQNEFENIVLPNGINSNEILDKFGYNKMTKLESMAYLVVYAVVCQILGIIFLKLTCDYNNKKLNKLTIT